ncbi:MAG: SWIM zinc finger family protein [Sandaracinaceae bacterium]|nr:SWIM zinc finger family protein [Sandaracinaceae bacterium]
MRYSLNYLGRSGVSGGPYRSTLAFQPNLGREPVYFDGELRDPLRFREAISALHDVVIGDLRFPKKDRAAYEAFQAQKALEEAELRKQLLDQEMEKISRKPEAPPANLESEFRRLHGIYWQKRRQWAWELMREDPELFRHLVPCDPIVTVADDVVFFECFAKDESSYGCLILDRDGFRGKQDASVGTTNVDYSMRLFEHFQTLRSYRETRLKVDPRGFEVEVEGQGDYREEKIDLPPSWLRGFGQISAATALPSRTVQLDVDVIYSLLAHLVRNREKRGPRSIRFELAPGRPPRLVLEPWEVVVESRGAPYRGDKPETIKVWGRRRLLSLARVLPLVERVEVHLLGSGMPSVWVAYCGELRFVLALSGWTANDWTSGGNLQLLSGEWQPDPATVERCLRELRSERALTPAELAGAVGTDVSTARAAMHRVCELGQAVFDYSTGAYRFRQVVDVELGEAQLGPEPPELTEGRKLFVARAVTVTSDAPLDRGRRHVMARVGSYEVEGLFDLDRVLSRASCGCSHHYKFKLKKGPCRHLVALRLTLTVDDPSMASTGIGGAR